MDISYTTDTVTDIIIYIINKTHNRFPHDNNKEITVLRLIHDQAAFSSTEHISIEHELTLFLSFALAARDM